MRLQFPQKAHTYICKYLDAHICVCTWIWVIYLYMRASLRIMHTCVYVDAHLNVCTFMCTCTYVGGRGLIYMGGEISHKTARHHSYAWKRWKRHQAMRPVGHSGTPSVDMYARSMCICMFCCRILGHTSRHIQKCPTCYGFGFVHQLDRESCIHSKPRNEGM